MAIRNCGVGMGNSCDNDDDDNISNTYNYCDYVLLLSDIHSAVFPKMAVFLLVVEFMLTCEHY